MVFSGSLGKRESSWAYEKNWDSFIALKGYIYKEKADQKRSTWRTSIYLSLGSKGKKSFPWKYVISGLTSTYLKFKYRLSSSCWKFQAKKAKQSWAGWHSRMPSWNDLAEIKVDTFWRAASSVHGSRNSYQ